MNPINNTVFSPHEGLTFDDVVLVPGFSDVLPDQVDVRTQLTSEITLAVPLLSAAMDKVTEAPMAIAMARLGGIGILHRNMSIEDQAAEARRVKRSQSGMISDPVTLGPDASLQEAEDLMRRFKFSGVPIIDKGGVLVGILTNRDIRFCEPADFVRPVSDFMTKAPLVTGNEDTTLAEAQTIIQKHRIEKLPLVDKDGHLVGIITVKDIMKKRDYPDATHDDLGRLRVGAAVGVGPDLEDRVEALMK
jgi:IMP dehydrogenase